ncbi:PRI2 [Lepeophtheirus salmonis]|uniref:DNA primase large subunit n=2 Tax=Lepeophtheirus salmonis TaxID=72036 RepID=A0A7R8HCI1_LEPSM|nr:PRI2 [Lepeophtheirus salmonis]CAF3002838.1 PRI2 [Lepeophtheirus salmonis]
MEFAKSSQRRNRLAARRSQLDWKGSSLHELYPSALQLYDSAPRDDISLEEFEGFALERLKLLRIFEKNSSNHGSEWRPKVEADLKSSGLESFIQVFGHCSRHNENRRKDHLSHFILRLAYARTEELRRWFITQEMDLFRFRFQYMSSTELEEFMKSNKLNYSPLDTDEQVLLADKLKESNPYAAMASQNYFKVHFTETLELVRQRRAFLSKGFVYVPDSEIISLLNWTFKSLLTQNLVLTCKTLPNLDEDERLVKMLNDLDKRYVGKDYSNVASDRVLPEHIAPLSEKSFPLCMKHIHDTLTNDHHIKYRARIQYGLFLKGIGLTLEDALSFFKGEFTKSHVKLDTFDKEYTYNIRYNYGLEGKKVNWAPWNCIKIIKENVGPGENHGCPYRHNDQNSLRSQLVSSGMKEEDIQEVLRLSREGHYQKACSYQFQARKGYEISTGLVNHPNQFYLESQQGPNKENTTKTNVKSERVLVFNNSK